jgi:hypothetical protein
MRKKYWRRHEQYAMIGSILAGMGVAGLSENNSCPKDLTSLSRSFAEENFPYFKGWVND